MDLQERVACQRSLEVRYGGLSAIALEKAYPYQGHIDSGGTTTTESRMVEMAMFALLLQLPLCFAHTPP